MSEDQVRILIVEARFYSDLADELLRGATDALQAYGAAYDVVTVPGALEIPGAIAMAHEAHRHPTAGAPYDGYVALGTVIRGETYHFELVANESGAGVTRVSLDHQVPIANAILTVENEAQALARVEDKARDAARVAVEMANLMDDLL